MNGANPDRRRYRVWIAQYEDWRPTRWSEMPPRAHMVEPALEDCLTWEQAAHFVAGFNEALLVDAASTGRDSAGGASAGGARLWAVAVPVAPRYEGDFEPGQLVESHPSRFEQFT